MAIIRKRNDGNYEVVSESQVDAEAEAAWPFISACITGFAPVFLLMVFGHGSGPGYRATLLGVFFVFGLLGFFFHRFVLNAIVAGAALGMLALIGLAVYGLIFWL